MKLCAPVLLLALMLAGSQAYAQDPKAQVFGGFSYANLDGSPRQSTYGWQVNGGAGIFKHVLFVADFGGQYKTVTTSAGSVSVSLYEYLFGPRYEHRVDRLTTFVHAMLGGATAKGSVLGFSASQSGFAMGFGGGLDVSMNKLISIRAFQADFVPTHIGAWQKNFRVGVGVVFKLGR